MEIASHDKYGEVNEKPLDIKYDPLEIVCAVSKLHQFKRGTDPLLLIPDDLENLPSPFLLKTSFEISDAIGSLMYKASTKDDGSETLWMASAKDEESSTPTITREDRDQAAEIRSFYQKRFAEITLRGGFLDPFQVELNKILTRDRTLMRYRDVGIISSLPKLYYGQKESDRCLALCDAEIGPDMYDFTGQPYQVDSGDLHNHVVTVIGGTFTKENLVLYTKHERTNRLAVIHVVRKKNPFMYTFLSTLHSHPTKRLKVVASLGQRKNNNDYFYRIYQNATRITFE